MRQQQVWRQKWRNFTKIKTAWYCGSSRIPHLVHWPARTPSVVLYIFFFEFGIPWLGVEKSWGMSETVIESHEDYDHHHHHLQKYVEIIRILIIMFRKHVKSSGLTPSRFFFYMGARAPGQSSSEVVDRILDNILCIIS